MRALISNACASFAAIDACRAVRVITRAPSYFRAAGAAGKVVCFLKPKSSWSDCDCGGLATVIAAILVRIIRRHSTYVLSYPDLFESEVDPYEHYVSYGRREHEFYRFVR